MELGNGAHLYHQARKRSFKIEVNRFSRPAHTLENAIVKCKLPWLSCVVKSSRSKHLFSWKTDIQRDMACPDPVTSHSLWDQYRGMHQPVRCGMVNGKRFVLNRPQLAAFGQFSHDELWFEEVPNYYDVFIAALTIVINDSIHGLFGAKCYENILFCFWVINSFRDAAHGTMESMEYAEAWTVKRDVRHQRQPFMICHLVERSNGQ